jgi:hypothetical protein
MALKMLVNSLSVVLLVGLLSVQVQAKCEIAFRLDDIQVRSSTPPASPPSFSSADDVH